MVRRRWLVLAAVVALAILASIALWMARPGWDIATASTNLDVLALDQAELASRGIGLVDLGMLELPSGRIVATDPLTRPDRQSLPRTVAPGRYPVTLFTAEGRVALATLRFSDETVDRWELALMQGQSTADLAEDEFYGYPVDTGLGSYMDADAVAVIERRERLIREEHGPLADYYNDVLHAELRDNGDEYLLHRPMPDSDLNIAIFGSGWGDGVYPAIWGLSARGEPVVLVSDFHVLDNGHVPDGSDE